MIFLIRTKKFLHTGFQQVVTLIVMFIVASCGSSIPPTDEIIAKDSLPEIMVKNVNMTYSDSGLVRMKLMAAELEDYSKSKLPCTIFPKGVFVNFFTESEKPESNLKAGYARYLQTPDIWEYKKNVTLVNKENSTLRTEELYVDRKNSKLYSKVLVSITMKNGTEIKGAGGFESNIDFTVFEFKDVSGKIPDVNDKATVAK